MPHEAAPEERRPVELGCDALAIVRIAAFDIHPVWFEDVALAAERLQQRRLIADLGLDDLTPQPLFQRLARLDLGAVALALRRVRIEVHKHGVGHAVLAAEYYGYIVVGQCIQQRQRYRCLLVFEHDAADILDRHTALHLGHLPSVFIIIWEFFRLRQ